MFYKKFTWVQNVWYEEGKSLTQYENIGLLMTCNDIVKYVDLLRILGFYVR